MSATIPDAERPPETWTADDGTIYKRVWRPTTPGLLQLVWVKQTPVSETEIHMKNAPTTATPTALPTPAALKAEAEAVSARISAAFRDMTPLLCRLYDRWQDEKEYEEFSDYAAEMRKALPAGFTFLAATRSPFGFTFWVHDPKVVFRMSVNSRTASWKVLR